jgi:hypothetical protein
MEDNKPGEAHIQEAAHTPEAAVHTQGVEAHTPEGAHIPAAVHTLEEEAHILEEEAHVRGEATHARREALREAEVSGRSRSRRRRTKRGERHPTAERGA